MSENKRYYWLKLQENWLTSKPIKRLRKLAGGDTFTIIYLKMLLRSLQDDGKLYYEGYEKTFAEELASDIDEKPDDVSIVVDFLMKCGLMSENHDQTEFLLEEAGEMIGIETASTRRSRLSRNRQKALQCNTIATPLQQNATERREDNSRVEIDTELDKEKELEDRQKDVGNRDVIFGIVQYLNLKCGTKYRASTKSTRDNINARLSEGFTPEDFKAVIDKKYAEWHGTEWEKYLTPDTLFRPTNFEKYLNQKVGKHGVKDNKLRTLVEEINREDGMNEQDRSEEDRGCDDGNVWEF